jgi:GT2 family glycosyltransferase
MFDIRITHKSIGMTNEEWDNNRKQFVEKYKENLPYNIESEIFYSKHKPIKMKATPHIGVIIPTKGNVDLLTKCVDSIWEKDDYPLMTIYIADTGSSPEEIEEIKSLISKHSLMSDRPRNIVLIEYDYYNFAQINNDVVWNHVGDEIDVLLFCNNDIELINNAVTRMVEVINKKGVGTVGARLHYGDGSIQHSGIIAFVGQDRRIMLSHKGLKSYYNYHNRNTEVFGNTAAFMMIKKDMFNRIGGFNQGYTECFEDVELNVDCLSRGLKNIFVSDAVCYHYESQTRKEDPNKMKREAEDYTKRLIPVIITSKRCHNYFDNISAKDLEFLIGQTMNRLVK